jgi:DNA-binding NtrC family response regulator
LKPLILAVDDEIATFRKSLEPALEEYALVCASNTREALAVLEKRAGELSCVLLDIKMPPELGKVAAREGLEILKRVGRKWPGLPVIMLSLLADAETAIEAVKDLGAFYYLTKPPRLEKLRTTVAAAVRARGELSGAGDAGEPEGGDRFGAFVGGSPAMREVYRAISRVAACDATVLVLGESGTGKELVASEVHRRSKRADGPLVTLNCAAIPENLLESQLFGHKKGAFTGATADHAGAFQAADGGTLFLDEVGELAPQLQAKLLRVLEDRKVTPVGATQETAVDIRLVAATNQDLVRLAAEGNFREDLLFRLKVIDVRLPRLAERGDDVGLLAAHFLAHFAQKHSRPGLTLGADALEKLRRHSWPGNVRELSNAIEKVAVLAGEGEIGAADLELRAPGAGAAAGDSLAELQAAYAAGTAEELGIKEFRDRHGEETLAAMLRWAIGREKDVRAAGELLLFIARPDEGEKQYHNLRQWMSKLGIRKKDVLGR